MFSVANLFAQKKFNQLSWHIGADMPASNAVQPASGVAGPVTGMHENMLLVAGGANFPDSMPWQGGKKKYYNNIYLFQKRGKQLIPVPLTDTLPEPIAYAAVCSTPMGIVYAGGENESGASDKAGLYSWDPASHTLHLKKLPDLPVRITNASATVIGNIVYVAGGENTNGVSAACWSLDILHPDKGWIKLPPLPFPVSHAVLSAVRTSNGDKLIIAGGRKKTASGISELCTSVYTFLINGTYWEKSATLPYPLSAGTGVVAGNNLLLFGGETGTTFSKVEALLAAISTTTDITEKENLILEKNKLLTTHPGFSREILLVDLGTGIVKPVGSIPYPAPVTTTAVRRGQDIIIPSGEIKAGVRSPHILIATLKRRYK